MQGLRLDCRLRPTKGLQLAEADAAQITNGDAVEVALNARLS